MRGEDVRVMFEARASALGIPHTNLTETGDLVAQVLAYENVDFPAPGEEPGCFGQLWEGPLADDCRGCDVQSLCLHRLGQGLHTAQQADPWGPMKDAEALGQQLSLSTEAAGLVLSYVRNVLQQAGDPSPRKPKPAGKSPKSLSETPTTPKRASPKATKASKAPSPPKSATSKSTKSKPSKTKSPKASAPRAADADVLAADAGPTTAKTASASGASSTPTRQKKNHPPTSIPTKATTKRTASTSETPKTKASSKSTKTTTSKPASAKTAKTSSSSEAPKKIPWGEHTHLTRWLRERQKSPQIGNLKVGATLHRRYKGRDIVVQIKQGHYLYESQAYPTLYSVVMAVTGKAEYARPPDKAGNRPQGKRKIGNWSATRFFAHELGLVTPC